MRKLSPDGAELLVLGNLWL